MIIHVYTMCYNEEVLMPYFLRHYSQFADKIFVYDNHSTDRTAEIVAANPKAIRILYGDKNNLYDSDLLWMKNEEYKKSRGIADWVIIADADEFVYHANLVLLLEKYKVEGISFPFVDGYDMVGDQYPTTTGQLYEEITRGVPNSLYSKRAVFQPSIDINYVVGAHHSFPRGSYTETKSAVIKLLHYRFLCKDFFVKNMERRMSRISTENLQRKWGSLILAPGETVKGWSEVQYEKAKSKRLKIVDYHEELNKHGLTDPFCGQLGNHLYQYAYVRLLAEKESRPFKLKSKLISGAFNLPEESHEPATKYVHPAGFPYYQGDEQLSLLYRNKAQLIQWFKPSDFGKNLLEAKNYPPVMNIRGGAFPLIGRAVASQYYHKVRSRLKKTPIVVTDDPAYAKSICPDLEILHTPDDFSILYHTKELICSNSTYCWWAAFLGNHELLVSPDSTWVKEPLSLQPFTWAINNMRWSYLKPDGSIGKRGKPMLIHVYVVCYNEEIMMPFFLKHYEKFADEIFVFDNYSTDNTPKIVDAHPKTKRILYGDPNLFLEREQIRVKNEEYKKTSRGVADWVIAVDADEFIYHPDIRALLEQYKKCGITLPKTTGYDMIGDTIPSKEKQIYAQIVSGVGDGMYAKRAVFNPALEINFKPGSHACTPAGNVVESPIPEIKVLHYRFLGPDYTYSRIKIRTDRLSQENIANNWSVINLKKGETLQAHCLESFRKRRAVCTPVFIGGKKLKIQFGCGGSKLEGWQNYDQEVDLRKPLPFAANGTDFVFLEHVLEHLCLIAAWNFLEESHRILKPGGVIRLVLPSIGKLKKEVTPEYLKIAKDMKFSDGTLRDSVHSLIFGFNHQSIWTPELLTTVMDVLGFRSYETPLRVSTYPELNDIERHWKAVGKAHNDPESFAVEGVK